MLIRVDVSAGQGGGGGLGARAPLKKIGGSVVKLRTNPETESYISALNSTFLL